MFSPRHHKVSHRISLPLPADEALELFTPEGERLWIADWNPRHFHPANGETMEGMVFTTGEGSELTFWTLIEFDIVRHRLRYSRVTPGSRSTVVQVDCIPRGDHFCDVEVSYSLTGLSGVGNATIDAFVGAAYVAMIEGWRERIVMHLQRSPHRVFGGDI